MISHERWMKRCFELAQMAEATVSPNPMVGCVVVYQNKILGEGMHQQYGDAHAEVHAIRSIPKDQHHLLAAATLYVNLEPCFHFGNTPPCVDLVLKHKIPVVVISCTDPDPRVSGKSIKKLRAHGVTVIEKVLEKEGKWLNRYFFQSIIKKRPYVILKIAQSLDGYIGKEGQTVWITNPIAKRLAHKWRANIDAILVGTNTAKIDDPSLTNRLWDGQSPTRLVLDRQVKLSNNLKLFNQKELTICFSEKEKLPADAKNLKFVSLPFDENLPRAILDYLKNNTRVQRLLIEGGAYTIQSFIDLDLWDEIRILTADHILGSGIKAPTFNGIPKHTFSLKNNKYQIITNPRNLS